MKIREIKRFSRRAFNAVSELVSQLAPATGSLKEEHFRKVLKSKDTHLFVAENDNRIIGMMTIAVYNIPSATRFWIEDVVVDVTQRGKGLGKELINHAIVFARSSGARTIDLTSRPFRIEANQLYRKSGFEIRETNVYRYTL